MNKYFILLACVILGLIIFSVYKVVDAPLTAVSVLKVTHKDMERVLEVNGTVVSQEVITIKPYVDGVITAMSLEIGNNLNQGDLLLKLDNRQATYQLNKAKIEKKLLLADIKQAQHSLNVIQQLQDLGTHTNKEYIQLQHNIHKLHLQVEQTQQDILSSQLALEHTQITAPFTGVLLEKYVAVGQQITTSTPLLKIANLDKIAIQAMLYPDDIKLFSIGQQVIVLDDRFATNQQQEKIIQISPSTQKHNNQDAVMVTVSLDSLQNLIIGQQLMLKIILQTKKRALQVPTNAIVQLDNNKFVALVRDGKVYFQQVITGMKNIHAIEILEGINENDRIIVSDLKHISEHQAVTIDDEK
jgi:membrane fusion protein, multidrug efflux system